MPRERMLFILQEQQLVYYDQKSCTASSDRLNLHCRNAGFSACITGDVISMLSKQCCVAFLLYSPISHLTKVCSLIKNKTNKLVHIKYYSPFSSKYDSRNNVNVKTDSHFWAVHEVQKLGSELVNYPTSDTA